MIYPENIFFRLDGETERDVRKELTSWEMKGKGKVKNSL